MTDGWDDSAVAWIAEIGEEGDFGRACVLDAPMLARIRGRGFRRALDVGCGEGRFCRLLQDLGIGTVGIDPTDALLRQARARDPEGAYLPGRAEALPFADGAFDLVVSYLTLIDMPDAHAAIPEMARVLAPGGTLLVANLSNLASAGAWLRDADGVRRFRLDDYLEERAEWAEWSGIRVRNWHRPLSLYMTLLLGRGLILRHFDEPVPHRGDPAKVALYRRVPWFMMMEWEKPAG
ncbi:class I SAM-dependent methyltransferase [Methylobacterium nonmethylotrophicum]|uniref:Class I SAM-dependent methyltransferase n=1 Tax=Methylobacterium nonmethylotrophicum TaxID=1141884 RepID=A0A4Z0NQM2_9HYPH|nr:class I SAM-dependent methyltransferase [Methylobacterium nonmethylotrophicum]TGD98637.1 class I SAM-dependent methyltransferase [Methylobacterium nonmethylotrophicum]